MKRKTMLLLVCMLSLMMLSCRATKQNTKTAEEGKTETATSVQVDNHSTAAIESNLMTDDNTVIEEEIVIVEAVPDTSGNIMAVKTTTVRRTTKKDVKAIFSTQSNTEDKITLQGKMKAKSDNKYDMSIKEETKTSTPMMVYIVVVLLGVLFVIAVIILKRFGILKW